MEHSSYFFDNWSKLGRSLVLAFLAYLALVILLRLSGKRTLTKLNVFDFVFVVALGSTLATTILSQQTTLADGVAAFAVLIALQVVLSWLCVSSHRINNFINGEPTLVVHKGTFLEESMRHQRLTKEEILSAFRESHVHKFDEVDSVVLETDGTLSIVWRRDEGKRSSMMDVHGHPDFIPNQKRAPGH